MRGGAQSHLMRCVYNDMERGKDQQGYFVVKFTNNPQGVRILANELLATLLARKINLPAPHAEQVDVAPELVEHTPELRVQLAGGQKLCTAGRQFGSQFPGDPRTTAVFDFVPDTTLDRLGNLSAFWGMLAFDQWTCNTNGRQAVFVRDPKSGRYQALMIDHGFCFNDGEWNFPDAPLRGLYLRRLVYRGVTGWDSFEPWLSAIEGLDTSEVVDKLGKYVPLDWYGGDDSELEALLKKLDKRRKKVRDLLSAVRRSSAAPFPNWREL
jgi:hypothetical protein